MTITACSRCGKKIYFEPPMHMVRRSGDYAAADEPICRQCAMHGVNRDRENLRDDWRRLVKT